MAPYETQPVPCAIQTSSNQVRPDTAQQSQCRPNPPDVTSPAGIRDNAAEDGHAGTHGSDDIANPVNEIQQRAFRLRPGLALNRHV